MAIVRPGERAADALRPVSIERGFTQRAEGCALISMGETRVLCTASVEDRVPPFLRDTGRGWVTAEYAMLPRSTHERISRDAAKKGRALEISRLIGRSLRSVVDLEFLGERQITVDCDVLQADGGTRTAAVTGGYVALAEAVNGLVAAGMLAQAPFIGACAAVSVGMVEGEPVLDLCYVEDAAAGVDLNLVMRDDGALIELQATAESQSYTRDELDAMLDLGAKGVTELLAAQREALARD